MAELTQNIERLLDRLYNLKSDENFIIQDLISQIERTEQEIHEAEDSKRANEKSKVNCEGKLELFLAQKQAFEDAFQGLDDNTFSALRDIDVNLELGSLLAAISDRSPAYCDGLKKEIDNYQNNIDEIIIQKGDLTAKLVTLESKKSTAEADRSQLVSLLEQSLSNDEIERDSLTAHYVKRILMAFDIFEEEELSKLTKMLMFPDEGLYQYDRDYAERKAKGLINLDAEAEEVVEEIAINQEPEVVSEPVSEPEQEEVSEPVSEPTTEVESEPVLNPIVEVSTEVVQDHSDFEAEAAEIYGTEPTEGPVHKDIRASEIDLSALNFDTEEPSEVEEDIDATRIIQPIIAITEEAVEEVPTEEFVPEEETEAQVIEIEEKDDEHTIETFLRNIGIEVEKFEQVENTVELKRILEEISNVDPKVVEQNYEILRSLSLEEMAYKYRRNHMYLTDTEFNKKLTLLRDKGISEKVIQRLIEVTNSGLRENLETIINRIAVIENIHRKVDDSNIKFIQCDMVTYENNLELLSENGYELDEKEIRNHNLLLFESLHIPEDVAILKDYLIRIVKSNGKYALSIFWKKPEELMNDIDSLIEADLENIIATNPEALGVYASELIKRVKYCEEHGHPIYESNQHIEFCDYIVSYPKFQAKFGRHIQLPALINKKEINAKLAGIIGNEDYSEILINTLDAAHEEPKSLIGLTIVDEMKEAFEELKHALEEKMGAKPAGKYTYKLQDICISKNKFERNLMVILNALAIGNQKPEGVEKEIILAAALYNVSQDEEKLRMVVNGCLGFNQENTLGGMKL